MFCYEKEQKCQCGGLDRDSDGNPIFKSTFRYGWTGAQLDYNGRGASIGDYGSLIYCNWDFKPISDGRFLVQGERAIIWINPKRDGQLKRVLQFIEHSDFIEVISENNEIYPISLCDPVAVEWLTLSGWDPKLQRYLSSEELII